jgi:GNAT superfamily N-acetyltransferase
MALFSACNNESVQMPLNLRICPIEPQHWPDVEMLFEERGGPKNCWCMVWRDYARGQEDCDKSDRKAGMRERIAVGLAVGLLAYVDDVPVAWCSVAPRRSFKESLDGKVGGVNDHKWSLTCMFVKRSSRSQGLSDRLIEHAIAYSRLQGATMLEAYPVAPDSPSYRFCGFLNQFDRHGFKAVGRVGSRRTIVALTL